MASPLAPTIMPQDFRNETLQIWSERLVLPLGLLQLTITFSSVVFNAAVIFTIVYCKDLHKPIFILYCNLAVSDLLSSGSSFWIAMLFITDPESTVLGSEDLLRAYASYTITILATIYNLVLIAVQHYLTVVECLRRQWQVTRNRTVGLALAAWLLASFLGFLPLMGWNCLEEGRSSSTLYGPLCMDYLVFVTVPHCAVATVLPLFIYVHIVGFLREQKTKMEALGQAFATYKLAEVQVVRMSVSIWLLALLSYAPFFVGVLLDSVTQQGPGGFSEGVYVFRNLTAVMITLNSLGNPIIYCLKVKRLKEKLRSLRCVPKNRIEVHAIGDV